MSKGSKPRPMNRDKFNENFDKIFGKKKANKPKSDGSVSNNDGCKMQQEQYKYAYIDGSKCNTYPYT